MAGPLGAVGRDVTRTELQEASLMEIAGFEGVIKNAAGGDGHTDRVLKVRFMDPAPYVQMAMKHMGLFRDQVEVEHRVTWEDIIAASRAGKR